MGQVFLPKAIWRRLESHDGLYKAAVEFVQCLESDTHPPRIYKPSGIARDGSIFHPYLRLSLSHHHLHASGDPLLILQLMDGILWGIGISDNNEYVLGDKMLWLKNHADILDWELCEDIEEEVRAYNPQAK